MCAAKKRNILFIHSSSDLYGASRVLLQTVLYLSSKGYYVIVALPERGELSQAFIEKGIHVEICQLAIIRRKYFNFFGLFNRFMAYFVSIFLLTRIIRRNRINLVYSNTLAVLVGSLVARINRVKHIWHIHEIIPGPKVLLSLIGRLAQNSTCLVVSESVKDHWSSIIGEKRLNKVYNGFDFNYLNFSTGERLWKNAENELTIGMIARVHFWKGQKYFLEICHRLKKSGVKAKFVMAGDAFPGYEYLYDEIKESIDRLGLKSDIIDLGYRSDVGRVLENLDLFILPSIAPDPLPTTVLEAMYMAKPVVATNHGGSCEMVKNGETGLLIPFDDPEKASSMIYEFIQQKELKEAGLLGKERVTKMFSLDQYQRRIEALIENGIS